MLAEETNVQKANKAILHIVVEAINKGNNEKACSFTHPECTLDGKPFGRAGDLIRTKMMHTAWPDQTWTWDALIAEGEWVAARFTCKGTFSGPMGEIPPNGKEIVFTGVSVYRFQEGQIVELWEYYDKLDLYQQMGVIPAMG